MIKNKQNIESDMHEIIFTLLNESIKEAQTGNCSQINIQILSAHEITLEDNGRGIVLNGDEKMNYDRLNHLFASKPITKFEYDNMLDFSKLELQTISSLCEKFTICVYKNKTIMKQEFVNGIAQHEIFCEMVEENKTGMKVTIIPEHEIFGDVCFSKEKIEEWIKGKTADLKDLTVTVY